MCRCGVKANWKIKYIIVGQAILFIAGIIAPILYGALQFLSNCSNIEGCSGAIAIGVVVGSIFIGALIGLVWRCRAKLFPVCCGHRKPIFTGTSSIPLRTILLSIDSGLPSLAEIQQLKNKVLLFLNAVEEELQKKTITTTFECIFAGSIEERYGVPYNYKKDFPSQLDALYSDFDVMFCCESFNASFTRQGNILVEHLGIDENLILAGYALLKGVVPAGSQNLLLDSYEPLKRIREAVRSSKASNLPVNAFWGLFGTPPIAAAIKGPSVKVVVNRNVKTQCFEGDITLCVKCLEWPSLSDWPTRKNRLWPSLEDVRRITSHGFHLVAKPLIHNNGDILPAWRFSFSVAEVELSKLVPDTARRCFMALKVILKDHLQPVVPDLSSYHIKTIFLNTLEKKPENFWVDENIEECFQTLLKELHDALESKTCQHHWLKQVNLFGHIAKTNRKRFSILVQKLEKIQEDPAPFIYDDGRCCVCPCFTSVRKNQLQRSESQEVLIDQDAAVDPANVTVINVRPESTGKQGKNPGLKSTLRLYKTRPQRRKPICSRIANIGRKLKPVRMANNATYEPDIV